MSSNRGSNYNSFTYQAQKKVFCVGFLSIFKRDFAGGPRNQKMTMPDNMSSQLVSIDKVHMHCWGPNLFWHGCNESQIFGPQTID